MKKIIFLFLFMMLLFSCSLPENETTTIDVVPISEIEMPSSFAKDSITHIPITYTRPTTCHVFTDFYYQVDGDYRIVAIYCAKLNQSNCTTDVPLPTTVNLPFKPGNIGTYHFKFYTGTNQENIDQYIEYDAVVNH